jgi:ADP-dependent NAD(P)H-hydrate dehydratase / NAD(P)H-hydrate epimerase
VVVAETTFHQARPRRLYTADEVRRLDRSAIETHGIPGIALMKRAGRAVFDALCRYWPDERRIAVIAGKGNNAGDGYVVAGLALQSGRAVRLLQIGDPASLQGDAARARDWALAHGLEITVLDAEAPVLELEGDLLVDALLGTGLQGEVRAGYAAAIEQLNASRLPVIAIDLPSGLCADRGVALGTAVRAALTVTVIGAKRGLYTGAGRELAGTIVHDDLGVPPEVFDAAVGIPALLWQDLRAELPERGANAHKGQFGHVLVIGGDHGMGGAVAMSAEAALRSGAGLVSVATRPEHVPVVLARRPEVMVRGVDRADALADLLERATVVAIGPGLGRSDWSRDLLRTALAAANGRPLVIDADALNGLASEGLRVPAPAVLTPHPGEAARLLGKSGADVQADRFTAALDLAARDGCVAVLKGAGTVIAADRLLGVCVDGNPALATAGTGDVLTGVVAGMLAQGLAPERAAPLAVCLHAATADLAVARSGARGFTATDLLPALRAALNGSHEQQ